MPGILHFTRRDAVSARIPLFAALNVAASLFVVSSVLILWAGAPLGQAYSLLFEGAFGSRFAIAETLTRATPLIFSGLAVAIAFRAHFYNIGAEGQLYLGALGAVAVGTGSIQASPYVLWPLMGAASAAAGALLVLGPAIAKIKFGVDEVVTTLLLNFIALLFVSMMLEGPLKDPAAMGWPQSLPIIDELQLPQLLSRTRVHAGLLVALGLAGLMQIVVTRAVFGYEVQAVGANAEAARFAGIAVNSVLLRTALLSGALAGIGGMSEVAGRAGYLTVDMAPGYGFAGIVIAMLARLHPLIVVAAAIAVAALTVGGDSMSRVIGVPTYLTDVLVATALIAVLLASMLVRYKLAWR